jgi:hypothetical protein
MAHPAVNCRVLSFQGKSCTVVVESQRAKVDLPAIGGMTRITAHLEVLAVG